MRSIALALTLCPVQVQDGLEDGGEDAHATAAADGEVEEAVGMLHDEGRDGGGVGAGRKADALARGVVDAPSAGVAGDGEVAHLCI